MSVSKYITEEDIDKYLLQLESEQMVSESLAELLQAEPAACAAVFSKDIDVLLEQEKGLLTYIATALWTTVKGEGYTTSELKPEEIETIEEKQFELFQAQKGSFRDRLDIFYKDYPQEDLLALVEDLLESEAEEEDALTKEGKELIFIKCKTLLEVLLS